MACIECAERRKKLRDAVLHGKMADALDITVEGLRVMIGIDSASDHRGALPSLSGKNKAELLAIAADESVVMEDDATNADIVAAIELTRKNRAE